MKDVSQAFHEAFRTGAYHLTPRRGIVRVEGPDGLDLFHRLSTNALLHLTTGVGGKTAFATEKGRLVDFVTAGVFDDFTLAWSSWEDGARLINWVDRFTVTENIRLVDVTSSYRSICLIGKDVDSLVIPPANPVHLPPIQAVPLAPLRALCLIDRTGPLTICQIVSESEVDRAGILELVHGIGLVELDDDTAEVLRISLGLPAGGHEVSQEFTPYDAGLASYVDSKKGCYIGQEVLARLETFPKSRHELVGIRLNDLPEEALTGAYIYKGDVEIGTCTSLAPAAVRGTIVGLAVVRVRSASPGDTVFLRVPGGSREAEISPLPMRIDE